jgi:probable rRNA maturation factor
VIFSTVVSLNQSHELVIEVADEQSALMVDRERIRLAVARILEEAGIERAQLSIAMVDDQTIRALNQRYLDHDDATDVLSFALERSSRHLDGQIVASTETARREAARYGWSPHDELLLYVIHGALHLVGYDDTTSERRAEMREREESVLGRLGLKSRWDQAEVSGREPEDRTP